MGKALNFELQLSYKVKTTAWFSHDDGEKPKVYIYTPGESVAVPANFDIKSIAVWNYV